MEGTNISTELPTLLSPPPDIISPKYIQSVRKQPYRSTPVIEIAWQSDDFGKIIAKSDDIISLRDYEGFGVYELKSS